MKACHLGFGLLGNSTLLCLIGSIPAMAEIIPDATLPNNSLVIQQGNTSVIEGGTQAGGNIFHSFREFSVPRGGAAFFNNGIEIQNIFSRVTGGAISNIYGLIRANGTANLFLLNPNGIIFGPHAQLNIGGSFLASTASSIKFADGTFFGTTNPQTAPLLTISVPIGLQMGPKPGNIVVHGPGHNLSFAPDTFAIIRDNRPVGLQVTPGQTLALLGGNLSLKGGNLTAKGSRIELGSVGGETLVTLIPMNQGMALSYPEMQNFGDISLSRAASVDATGAGGGDVFVVGRRVTLTDGSAILALTEGAKAGGTLSVRASEVVQAIGTTPDAKFSSGLFTEVNPTATGQGGDVKIETARLQVANGAQVSVSTFGPGKAGNLTVKATDTVELIASGLSAQANPKATGEGGNLTVETARLQVANGAQVSVSTFGSGKAGNLTVKATDTVELSGRSADGSPSGLFAASTSAISGSTGDGGNLMIETGRLTLQDGAKIYTSTFGQGKAGNLTVKASDAIELIGFSSLSTSAEQAAKGDGGNLRIETARLRVANGSGVSVTSFGEGKAGNLILDTGSIWLENSSSLTGDTKAGGGSIELRSPTITLRRGSSITTNATGEKVKGGNITIIDSDVLVALEDSDITANSKNSSGGQVFINTKAIFGTQFREAPSPESDITATGKDSTFSGNVTINTPDVDPSSGLIELPQNLVDATQLVDSRCSPQQQQSTFIVTGRGGLPTPPNEPLNADSPWEDWRIPEETQPNTEPQLQASINDQSIAKEQPETIVEAQGWYKDTNGNIVLTAEPNSVTPQGSWLNYPNCSPSSGNSSLKLQ